MNINKIIGEKGEESRKRTIQLFTIAIISLMVGLIWGISNNFIGPAVFMTGLGLLVLAVFQNWASIRVFVYLLIGSFIGFGVFTVLHNFLYGLAEKYTDMILLRQVLEGSHAFFFLLAVLLCPAVFIASVVGLLMRTYQAYSNSN